MNSDITIGCKLNLWYWRFNEVYECVIKDIYFERYLTDWKTRIQVEYYIKGSNCWILETYYINDFFDSLLKAKEADNKN